MPADLEKALARELRAVAEGLDIPAMPGLPNRPPRPHHRRQPLLVAAAVLAIVLGAAAVVTNLSGRDDGGPVRPSPTPVPSRSPDSVVSRTPIPTSVPQLPHVLDRTLFVGGEQVPGTWWMVRPAVEAWIAVREDGTWWWGRGPRSNALPGGVDAVPQISPGGRYVAVVEATGGDSVLTVVDTESGEPVGGTPASITDAVGGGSASVAAVLDEGKVVVRGPGTDVVLAVDADRPRLLAEFVPGRMVTGATTAGVVVTEGNRAFLAEVDDDGTLRRVGDLPPNDDVSISPKATWLVWTPIGTTGGEVASVPSLEVRRLEDRRAATLRAPRGWDFAVRTWAWEDDEHLVATVISPQEQRQRLARCSPGQRRCVLTDAK